MKIRNYLLFLAVLASLQSISGMQFTHAPTLQELAKYSSNELDIAQTFHSNRFSAFFTDTILLENAKKILFTLNGHIQAIPILQKLLEESDNQLVKIEASFLLCKTFNEGVGNAPRNTEIARNYLLRALEEKNDNSTSNLASQSCFLKVFYLLSLTSPRNLTYGN